MTPKYIREECTEEELAHLFKSRTKRLKRLRNPTRDSGLRRVAPAELYDRSQSMTVAGSDGVSRPVMGLSGICPKRVTRKPN